MSPIDYLGEGRSDEVIARRMIASIHGTPGLSYRRPLSGVGKQSLDSRLQGLNKGAQYRGPILVLRDLDKDAPCAPELVSSLVPQKSPRMLLRICVASAESWLLADRDAYAEFCGCRVAHIPGNPEGVSNLKQLVRGLGDNGTAVHLRRHFDKFRPRRVPEWGMLGDWHAQFAETLWDPVRAAESGRAPSLKRALDRLREAAT
jgi:hypothetical protein